MSDVLPEAQCSLCVVAEFVHTDESVEGVWAEEQFEIYRPVARLLLSYWQNDKENPVIA
jgi:hypothetical protein